jgi:hypothetical protein
LFVLIVLYCIVGGERWVAPTDNVDATVKVTMMDGGSHRHHPEFPMTLTIVPDFFQEETEEAIREQVNWLIREVGVDDSFFTRSRSNSA